MNKRLIGLISLVLLTVLGSGLGLMLAQEQTIKMMAASEIKPGMKGYGKTVFHGTKIEKFNIEVIGVLKNAIGPKHDIILVRCKHPVIDKAGIIAGMSGSPVYIIDDPDNSSEGRLIGALGYAWGSFQKEPIAGVTPIAKMLEEMEKPLEKTSYRPIKKSDTMLAGLSAPKESRRTLRSPFGKGQLTPLITPLFVSGVNPRRMPQLEKMLAPYGLLPIQTGGATESIKEKVSRELEPGSPMGVTLVRGDEDWTGIGTLTYRDGDKFLAFGHSMNQSGEFTAPVTTAYVYGTMPSMSGSFKLASAVDEVGVLTQDRLSCVAGLMNKKARMVPLHITVENLKTKSKTKFNYEVLHHKTELPGIVPWLMMGALDATEPSGEPAVVEVLTSIKIKDFDTVKFRRLVSGSTLNAGCGSVNNIFVPIWNNPFVEISVEDVSFEVKVLNEDKSVIIQNIWLDKYQAAPGEEVKASVLLRPYRKEPFIKEILFSIPADMPDQDLDLTISGGGAIGPVLPIPRNLTEYIKYLQSYYNESMLVTIIPYKSSELRYRGRRLPRLPNSILSPLINQMWLRERIIPAPDANAGYSGHYGPILSDAAELGRESKRIFTPTDYIITSGPQSISLKIRKHH